MLSEEKFGKQPDGTGPFRVIQLTDRMCLLEAYPAYFRERALLDRVEIWSMPGWHAEDESTFNVIHNPVRAADDKLWQQIDSPVSVIKFLTMNASKTGPLMNPENRRIVVNALRGGQNPDGLAVSSDQSLSTPFFRQPLILTTIQPYQHDAERVASMLGAHGIPVSIQLVTPDDFKGEARLQSDLILFSIIRDQDEQLRLFDLYHNMSDHLEPLAVTDVRTLLERVTKETDPHARNDLYLKLKSQLEQKHLLYILSERRSAAAVHRSIRGVRFNPQGWVDLRSLWFSTQPLKSSNE